jgi:hypothetical protein
MFLYSKVFFNSLLFRINVQEKRVCDFLLIRLIDKNNQFILFIFMPPHFLLYNYISYIPYFRHYTQKVLLKF